MYNNTHTLDFELITERTVEILKIVLLFLIYINDKVYTYKYINCSLRHFYIYKLFYYTTYKKHLIQRLIVLTERQIFYQ